MTPTFHILNPSEPNRPWVKAMTDGTQKIAPWTWVSREHPEHTETLVDWALKEDVKRLIVWGGDGTFHRVVRALLKRGALGRLELGLVPVGTCNDLARRLNLSKYYWRRWEAPAPEGRLAAISVGKITWRGGEGGSSGDDIFVNNAGFGRPRRSFENKENAWGVLKSFQPIRLSAEWPAGRLQGLYYMVLACSGPFFSGGLYFEKSVSPEQEGFRVFFVPATSKVRLALRLLRGKLGLPLADDKTTRITTSRLTIDTETPVWPQADGEAPPESGVRAIQIEALPDRARLWIPE
jgi:diacylglycerol kinase family enzyme